MTQLLLPHNGTAASREAAEHQDARKVERDRQAILEALRRHPDGLTRAELSYMVNLPINIVTPRVYELINKYRAAVNTDHRRVSRLSDGKGGFVFSAVKSGVLKLACANQ